MITRRLFLTSGAALVSPLFIPAGVGEAATLEEMLAVVAAKDGGMDGFSLHQLKRAYLGDDVQGPHGKIIPLNREPKGPERVGFDRSVLDMSPDAVARYWIDRKIRGQSAAPKAIEPGSILQKVVARLPGAIGYVRAHEVTSDVKVLLIDGKKPGDAGYPILAEGPTRAQAENRLMVF